MTRPTITLAKDAYARYYVIVECILQDGQTGRFDWKDIIASDKDQAIREAKWRLEQKNYKFKRLVAADLID